MPELPEVETVRRTLAASLVGRTFGTPKILWDKSVATGSKDLWDRLAGKKALGVDRRGKFLSIRLSQGLSLRIHLRMEGKLFLYPDKSSWVPSSYDRVLFPLSGNALLVFNDSRKFGRIWLETQAETEKAFSRLGPEADALTPAQALAGLTRYPNRPIKELLLDQTVFAGIGNIYADEIDFACGFNPFVPASHYATGRQAARLAMEAHRILKAAVNAQGSTVKTYRPALNHAGSYQTALMVYGREKKPCKVCQTIIRKRPLGGRGTSYCPHCQKVPPIVGIFGGIASGKTTVRKALEGLGFWGIDTDRLAKAVTLSPKLKPILSAIEPNAYRADGTLAKPVIRALLTRDPIRRKAWLSAVYSALREAVLHIILSHPSSPIAIEAPLLFAAKLDGLCDFLLLTKTDDPLAHLKARNDPDPERSLALGRTNPWKDHESQADAVLVSDGPIEELIQKADAIGSALLSKQKPTGRNPVGK